MTTDTAKDRRAQVNKGHVDGDGPRSNMYTNPEPRYTRSVYYQASKGVRAVELWEVMKISAKRQGDAFVQSTTFMEWDARPGAQDPGPLLSQGGHTAKRTAILATDLTLTEGRSIVDIMVRARMRVGYKETS